MAAVFAEVEPLVEQFRDTELQQVKLLQGLVGQLKSAPTDNAEAFAKLFALASEMLHADDLQLARVFKVSRPTIGRWTRGESTPHPLGRRPVFQTLLKMVEAEIRKHAPDRPALRGLRRIA
jgi:hypothetical protein